MLVRKIVLMRFILAAIMLFSAAFPVYADTQTCEADEQFYNGIAQKLLTELQTLSPKLNEYNEHIKQAITNSDAPCYILSTQIVADDNKNYGWSGFDLRGAAMVDNSHKEEIKNLLSTLNFSNINIDFAPYDYKNNGRISAANIALKLAQTEEKKQNLQNDLLVYQKCKAEIFNLQQEQSSIKKLQDNASLYLKTLAAPQSTTCSCDESGILKACSTVTETAETEAPQDMSCRNLNEYTQDTSFCPTCTIFERILVADQKLAGGAFGVLADSLIKILSIGFLIYLALQTLTLVSAPSKQPIGKYLTSITVQGFKVLIAVLILSNPSFLYNLALKPIIEGGLDFGITLTGKAQADIVAAGTKYTGFNTSDALLSAPFLQKMVGAADVFNEQAAIMPAMGRALVCNAFENLSWNIFPNIETMLEGVLVVIFGYIISLSVGFYLLDLTLELGFFCCLLPFLIACWPFKITRGYTKKGWEIFMHIFFNFVMLGVIITTINAISQRAMAPNHDIKQLINALNTNDFDMIKKLMEIGGVQMMMLIVCCYICLKLLEDVNNLANKFAGGAGFNISPAVGGLAMSAAVSFGKTGGTTLFKNFAAGTDAMAEASGVKGALNETKEKVSDSLGITKMRGFAHQLTANAGIGANAVHRGGRNDSVNGFATQSSSKSESSSSESQQNGGKTS